MKKTVIFGAGQIGRGFIGDICHRSGYELVFVDVSEKLVSLLNESRSYPLWLLSERKEEQAVTGLRALLLRENAEIAHQLSETELAFTAVGAANLAGLAPALAGGIEKKALEKPGSPLNIIICENLLGAAEVLRKAVEAEISPAGRDYLETQTGFVGSVVSRMVAPLSPEKAAREPLMVTVEPYKVLPVSRPAFRGNLPPVEGLRPVEDLYPWEEMKIFVHNLSHACLAYLGYLRNHAFIWQALEDPLVRPVLEGVFEETGHALRKKHSFPGEEINRYQADLAGRFANRSLGDTVARVARDPMRKIGPEERLAGGIKLCLSQGVRPANICVVAAACLCYNNTAEDESASRLQSLVREKGVKRLLGDYSLIDDSQAIMEVERIYREIKNESSRFTRKR